MLYAVCCVQGQCICRHWTLIGTHLSHLVNVDAMVQRPHRLEVVLHSLLHLLGDLMERQEVLQVSPFGLIKWAPGVHPLYDGSHIAKHHSMHQSCEQCDDLYLKVNSCLTVLNLLLINLCVFKCWSFEHLRHLVPTLLQTEARVWHVLNFNYHFTRLVEIY